MRTTLTIDEDAAASLERLRATHPGSLQDLINDALRRGIKDMTTQPERREPFRTRVVDLGEVLIPLENISKALGAAEGETFK